MTHLEPQVIVPTSNNRCRKGTVTDQLWEAPSVLARGESSRCKFPSAGIGIMKTMTSATILKAVFEKRKPALSIHVPGTDLSQPLSTGVHIKIDRMVKVIPTATTKAIPTYTIMRLLRSGIRRRKNARYESLMHKWDRLNAICS